MGKKCIRARAQGTLRARAQRAQGLGSKDFDPEIRRINTTGYGEKEYSDIGRKRRSLARREGYSEEIRIHGGE